MMAVNQQLKLLGSETVIGWLPDETVFSLASRFHYLSGNIRPEITAKQLFGKARGGFPHDLPGGIEYLASAFEGMLGRASEIIIAHTVLPAIIAFRSNDTRQDAINTMMAGSIGSLKAKLGLLASRFGALLDLKACLVCMEEEQAGFGTAYWHVEHQLPGVWVCRKHHCMLCVSESKRAGQRRFDWILPRECDLVLPYNEVALTVSDATKLEVLNKISEASRAILAISRDEPLCALTIAKVVRERLEELGFASCHGRLYQKRVGSAFLRAMDPARAIPELARTASSPSVAYSQVLKILSADDVGMHPLRVVSVVAWLFGSWDAFAARYGASGSMAEGTEIEKLSPKHSMDRSKEKEQLIAMICRDGISLSEAAWRVGVEVSTAQAWATSEGIYVPKRPSHIKGDVRSELIASLRNGMEKNLAASNAGISIASVNRILRTEVGLHQAWVDARFERARVRARQEWEVAIKSASTVGIKAARGLAKAAYAWLYRNDRTWLNAFNKSVESIPRSNHASVNWVDRDAVLNDLVEKAVLTLKMENPASKILLTDIIKAVPQIRSKVRRIEKMPLTARLIRDSVGLRKPHCDEAKRRD